MTVLNCLERLSAIYTASEALHKLKVFLICRDNYQNYLHISGRRSSLKTEAYLSDADVAKFEEFLALL